MDLAGAVQGTARTHRNESMVVDETMGAAAQSPGASAGAALGR